MASIKKQSNGKWLAVVSAGVDPITGKRIQPKKRFDTQAEAKDWAREIESKYKKGHRVQQSNMTLEEFLILWLNTYAKQNMNITTYDNRVIICEKKIIPTLGHHKLKDLTPLLINQAFSTLSEKHADSYVKTIYSTLKRALSFSVKWDLMETNIMDKVDPPRVKEKQKVTWNIDQVNFYIKKAKETMNPNYYIALLTIMYTGIRRGESLGLGWSDFNYENKTISIRRSVVFSKSVGVHIQEGTKTKSSNRQISISEFLADELKSHKSYQNQVRLSYGEEYKKHDLIACKDDGSPISPRQLLKIHEAHCKACKLSYIPIHGLRHTHASALLEAGIHPKVVQERLGHATISTTMDIYSHVIPNLQKEAADKFDQVMNSSKKSVDN